MIKYNHIFSLPINPKLTEKQFFEFFNFCKTYKHLIYDLYFTCRMPPFIQDAMGDVIMGDPTAPIANAINLQKELDIPISATFNNTLVRPDQENLDLFISNFDQLYEQGVKIVTIPHTSWLMTGQLQKRYPDLKIKNTILRDVNKANQIARLAEAGFHYVNVDRNLMRDEDELKKMKRVADKYDIELSLLANEGCLGNCPVMPEHYQYNNSRISQPQYFDDPISRISCHSWNFTDPSSELKNAYLPPWKEDWDNMLNYVNVFKMHGRENIDLLYNSLDIVARYDAQQDILYDGFDEYMIENNLERPINGWREKIRNCKFDCWDCNYCDKVYETKSKVVIDEKVLNVINSYRNSVNLENNFELKGLTSERVQNLLFDISEKSTNVLEIGSGFGAITQCFNNNGTIHCVDNWTQSNIQPAENDIVLPENTKDQFLKYLEDAQVPYGYTDDYLTIHKSDQLIKNKNSSKNIIIHDNDIFEVDKTYISDVDLFFYDALKDEETISKTIEYFYECFSDTCILIFDDANWDGIILGTNEGVEKTNATVLYRKLIKNKIEDSSQWWNGLYIVVIKK